MNLHTMTTLYANDFNKSSFEVLVKMVILPQHYWVESKIERILDSSGKRIMIVLC